MNNKDNENKAKLVPNSEINEKFDENENLNEDLIKDQLFNFSYDYKGFRRISGWWIIIFLFFMISIPITILYLFYLAIRSIFNLIF
tara:strand:- start:3357 stop:3614 length:258 start_codon:yes stop_codon:yes gene_type:complete